MGVDCKSTGFAYAGSNPARPKTRFCLQFFKAFKERHFFSPPGKLFSGKNLELETHTAR